MGSGRFTLKKAPSLYTREVKCPTCGSTDVVSVEKSRKDEMKIQDTCHCAPIPFPHRAGSLRFCDQHPLFKVDPTEEEWQSFQGLLETPRTDSR